MTRSRVGPAFVCLLSLALWLAVACDAPGTTPGARSPEHGALLFTRTPTPSVTPTPTLHPQALYQQGLAQRDVWDLETALQRFNRSLALAASAPVYASRAEVYRLMGRYEEAAADIERTLNLDPELAEAWRQKALLSRERAAWNEALAAANQLIGLKPDDGSAYVLRAEIHAQGFGLMLRALFDYNQAIGLDPIYDKATLVERWHILAHLGDWDEALLVSHKMTTTGSEDPVRYFYRGWSLIELGRYDEAIQKLLFGLQRYPDYPVALYYALGVAYYGRQAWSEAVQALEVALAQSGTLLKEDARSRPSEIIEADILGWMGATYLELRQCETGTALVERAVAESPDPDKWVWVRDRIDACYTSLTPTPTPEGTPAP